MSMVVLQKASATQESFLSVTLPHLLFGGISKEVIQKHCLFYGNTKANMLHAISCVIIFILKKNHFPARIFFHIYSCLLKLFDMCKKYFIKTALPDVYDSMHIFTFRLILYFFCIPEN